VVIGAFIALATVLRHDRTGSPPRCSVEAPHHPIPQPNFVPFRFSSSRSTHKSGMSVGTSTFIARPFTISVKAIRRLLKREAPTSIEKLALPKHAVNPL
jgi:hypothetical protein